MIRVVKGFKNTYAFQDTYTEAITKTFKNDKELIKGLVEYKKQLEEDTRLIQEYIIYFDGRKQK